VPCVQAYLWALLSGFLVQCLHTYARVLTLNATGVHACVGATAGGAAGPSSADARTGGLRVRVVSHACVGQCCWRVHGSASLNARRQCPYVTRTAQRCGCVLYACGEGGWREVRGACKRTKRHVGSLCQRFACATVIICLLLGGSVLGGGGGRVARACVHTVPNGVARVRPRPHNECHLRACVRRGDCWWGGRT
jgi:hypothetical protein